VKQPSIIEQKAYRDTWGRGLDSYLQWFYETAVLLRYLLAEDGSIYVHRDCPGRTVVACKRQKQYIALV
jgi:adenine specific DNA methylase Mod